VSPPIPESSLRLSTILIAAGASLFFSSKGVFVKCAYQHGADYLTVLALRMAFALPFFVFTGWLAARRRPERLTRQDWGAMAGLGFLGYYLSSLLNFAGLAHISVGLERIVLYCYPTLVVLGAAVFFRQSLRPAVLLAALVSWLGIALAYAGETGGGDGHPRLGMTLIFGSALTYAAFILWSGEWLKRMGPALFTSGVVSFSGLFVLLHFLTQRPASLLFNQPAPVLGWSFVLATVSTIIPSYLMGVGVARAGASRFAIIGSSGPVMTVFLAWLMLGEPVNTLRLLGLALSVAGGLAVSLLKSVAPSLSVPDKTTGPGATPDGRRHSGDK
jgi:drug/metabolite transporter (DMT)-like permease